MITNFNKIDKSHKYKVINFINFPGSGTHLLTDILALVDIDHNPVLDLIVLLIRYDYQDNLLLNHLDDDKKRLFLEIYNELNKNDALTNFEKFADIIDSMYLSKMKKNSFTMLPHVFFENNHHDLDKQKLNFVKDILHSLNKYSKTVLNVYYIRNPHDILHSKKSRFIKNNDKAEMSREALSIASYFNYNKIIDKTHVLKYEDLCKDIKPFIKQLSNLYEFNYADYEDQINTFYSYKSSQGYKKTFDFNSKINFLDKIYKETNEETKKNKIHMYLLKNINQFNVVRKYIIDGDYRIDGAFHRITRTIPIRIFIRILLLIPKFKQTYKKLTSVKTRIKNKNILKVFEK